MTEKIRTKQAIMDEVISFLKETDIWRFLLDRSEVFRIVLKQNPKTSLWEVYEINDFAFSFPEKTIPIHLSSAEAAQFRPTEYSGEESE